MSIIRILLNIYKNLSNFEVKTKNCFIVVKTQKHGNQNQNLKPNTVTTKTTMKIA